MLMTNGTIITPGTRRRTINRQVSLGPISMRIVTIVIIAASAIITIAQTTKTATASYLLRSKNSELADVRENVKRLETEEVRLRALNLNNLVTQGGEPTVAPSPTEKLSPSDKINQLPSSANQNISQLPQSSVLP